jgi:hypothetical protein
MRPRLVPSVVPALLVALLAATDATAKVPDPRFSEIPAVIVGSPSGAALPSCGGPFGSKGERVAGFRVLIKEVNNAPLRYEQITLDFSQTSIHLLGDDRPGTTVDCAAHTITRFTDLGGVAVFEPRFCGSCPEAKVLVLADGVLMREIPARSTDVDGNGTTDILDFMRVVRNFQSGGPDPATDFDPCAPGSEGRTTLIDFVLFAGEMQRGPRGTACP